MSKTLDAKKVAGYPYTDGGKLDVLGDEGIIPSGTKIIEENGTDIDVYSYAKVDVNVPQGVIVNENYDISEGTLNGVTITLEGGIVANIPDGVVTLGKRAFSNAAITEVIMPNSVTNILGGAPWAGDGCFKSCTSLVTIVFSNALTTIGDSAFYGCTSLTSITIPDSVTSIGSNMFNGCTSLTSITIPNSVTSIGSDTFKDCISLTSITIPDSVTTISNNMFLGCTSLTSIIIPDGVTSIGYTAFNGCTSLTSITIPDSVTSIGSNAFGNCTNLTDIYYTGTQEEWEAIDGISDAAIPEGATIHYEYTPE